MKFCLFVKVFFRNEIIWHSWYESDLNKHYLINGLNAPETVIVDVAGELFVVVEAPADVNDDVDVDDIGIEFGLMVRLGETISLFDLSLFDDDSKCQTNLGSKLNK